MVRGARLLCSAVAVSAFTGCGKSGSSGDATGGEPGTGGHAGVSGSTATHGGSSGQSTSMSGRGGSAAGNGGAGPGGSSSGASGAGELGGEGTTSGNGGTSSAGAANAGGNDARGGSGGDMSSGGEGGSGPTRLTWLQRCTDATCWGNTPTPRHGVIAAFDAPAGETVIYGGATEATVFAETWSWDGTAWTERCPPASCTEELGPRQGAAAVFDVKRDAIVLFAGLETKSTDSCHSEGYAWNRTTWEPLGDASPAPRYSPGLAYDTAHELVVMFGGACSGAATGDTLGFGNSGGSDAWTNLCTSAACTASAPPERWGMAMTYDAARGVTLMFGGTVGDGTASDSMFAWDGAVWRELMPAHRPSPRSGARMVYDSSRRRVVLFGGTDFIMTPFDTWEWDGEDWSLIASEGPPGRHRQAMAYDALRSVVVMFGGADDPSTTPMTGLSDTWELVAE